MNPFGEARKLRDRLLALDVQPKIYSTTDESDELEGKLPAVAIEVDETDGETESSNRFKPAYHGLTIHCIVSAQNVSFDDACDSSVALSNTVMQQMRGLKIRVKQNGIGYAGYKVGAEKARAVVLECESYE